MRSNGLSHALILATDELSQEYHQAIIETPLNAKCHNRRADLYMCNYGCFASQVALVVKNPPAKQEMQETQVQPLGWEDPLE